MDSSNNTTRNSSLLLPTLLVGSVFSGSAVGIFLTDHLSPAAQPVLESIVQPSNMASNKAANEVANIALKQQRAEPNIQPRSFTSMALVADPAFQYLTASAPLTHDSKQLIGSINPVHFKRPEWAWSRTELYTNYAPMDRLFGVDEEKPDSVAVQPAAQTPAQPAAQPAAQTTTQTPAQPAAKSKVQPAVQSKAEPTAQPTSQSTAQPEPFEAAPIEAVEKTAEKNLNRLVVALDPGHGGIDPGSEAHNGLIEKELTLDMAKRVELFLSEIQNVDVIMTRSTDMGMSRRERVDKIQAANADVVVSLHFNHIPQTDVNLVESFYADRHNVIESLESQNLSADSVDLDYTESSKTLADILHRKVLNEVASVNENVDDAGVKDETLFVLTRSFTPGALLELTCISNPAEAERLATDEYRNQLAASIADGLRDYLMNEHSDQFAEILAENDSSRKLDQKL